MSDAESTKLTIRTDRSTALASSAFGSNLDVVGFNLAFIAARNPKLAVELLQLYEQARQVRETDRAAPEEDFALFAAELQKHLDD